MPDPGPVRVCGDALILPTYYSWARPIRHFLIARPLLVPLDARCLEVDVAQLSRQLRRLEVLALLEQLEQARGKLGGLLGERERARDRARLEGERRRLAQQALEA